MKPKIILKNFLLKRQFHDQNYFNFSVLLISIIAFADEDALREIMKKTYPELPIKSIKKTDYNDLYEVFIGGKLFIQMILLIF